MMGGTHPRSGVGGYPGQVWMVGGVPQSGLDGGGIPVRSGWWGVLWSGLDGGRIPQPGLDGVGGTRGTIKDIPYKPLSEGN